VSEVKSGDVARFLKNPPRSCFAFLFCGNDSGLVAERTKHLVATLVGNEDDPFRLVRLDGDALAQDSSLLTDEALTIGLFGGDRIIWISAGSKNFVPSLEALILLHPPGCRIVIEAGSLKSDSPLKRLGVKSPNVAVIECWPDGVREIASLIDDELSLSSLSITAEARDLLISMLGGDRLLSRGEIEKVKIYAYGQDSVTESEVLAVVADASGSNFDHAISTAFIGDRAGILVAVKRAVIDFDPATLLGLALGHAIMLHQFRLEIEGGRSIEEAVERGPKLFGKKKSSVLQQLRIWNAITLFHHINKLSESILYQRREPKMGEEIVIRALLGVTFGAPRKSLN
jgi:DNA polymerase-3 subunit delta